jgi:hypothetical protein
MRRKYEVEWYEFNLTQRRSRKFFTETGAILFARWISKQQDVTPRIKAYEQGTV